MHFQGRFPQHERPKNIIRIFLSPIQILFQVTRDIIELCRAHFRVRKAIFECLLAKAHYDGCEECAHVSAFQLAICYSIGFGVGRSADSAHFWQGKGILSKADLAGEIEDLKMHPRLAIEDQRMWELYDKGHLTGLNLARIYQKSENLESVLNLYNREISDMAAILGCDHLLVQILESELGLVLSEKGDYRAAETLQESLRQKKMTKYGVQSPRTWNTFLDLASTYGQQGKWKEAAQLLETVTDIANRLNGPKHIDSLAMMAYLASAYRGLGKLQQAEAKCLQIIEDVGSVLSHDHQFIFDVKEILASTYAKQGQWVKAEKMYRETKTGHHRISGPQDPATLTAQNGLAMTLYEQGKLKEAEELQSEIVITLEALYGLRHPWSLVAMSDLALILKAQGVYGRAKELLEKAIHISIKMSGREHRDTIKFISNLANVLQSEGKWEELLETQLEIVEIAKRILDDHDYPTLLLYSMNLAQTYTRLDKHSEAEALAHKILKAAEQRLGLEHLTTLKALLCLAGTYRAQCSPPRWSDTEKVEMRLVEVATRTLGPANPTTLLGMEYLAVTYLEQGRHTEAETLVKDILLVKQSHLEPSDISTLRSLNLLCRVYCLQGRLDLAEDLAANLSSITIAIFGLEAPFTLTCLSCLASIYRLQGRGDRTSELMLEALGIDVELSE